MQSDSKIIDHRYSQAQWDTQVISNLLQRGKVKSAAVEYLDQITGLGKRRWREDQ
jgi:hypothetical protein